MNSLTEPTERVAWLESNIRLLLAQVGEPGKCRGCGADIYWVVHRNGKRAPYTPHGLNHFADCPAAQNFKVKAKE